MIRMKYYILTFQSPDQYVLTKVSLFLISLDLEISNSIPKNYIKGCCVS